MAAKYFTSVSAAALEYGLELKGQLPHSQDHVRRVIQEGLLPACYDGFKYYLRLQDLRTYANEVILEKLQSQELSCPKCSSSDVSGYLEEEPEIDSRPGFKIFDSDKGTWPYNYQCSQCQHEWTESYADTVESEEWLSSVATELANQSFTDGTG